MKSIKIGYQHDVIQQYKKIKKGSDQHLHQFVVEGLWAYEKIIQTKVSIDELIYCEALIQTDMEKTMIHHLSSRSKNCYEISEKTMKRINSKDDPSGLVMICSKEPIKKSFEKIIILDGLENPGNIGTIFRTSDGAGIDAIFIVNQKAKINQYKIVKASMGGFFSIPWFKFNTVNDCMKYLTSHGINLLLADPNQSYQGQTDGKIALVVGNERYGLSKEWFNYKHETITIPMKGCCDSLNVGVAASILIYKIT